MRARVVALLIVAGAVLLCCLVGWPLTNPAMGHGWGYVSNSDLVTPVPTSSQPAILPGVPWVTHDAQGTSVCVSSMSAHVFAPVTEP